MSTPTRPISSEISGDTEAELQLHPGNEWFYVNDQGSPTPLDSLGLIVDLGVELPLDRDRKLTIRNRTESEIWAAVRPAGRESISPAGPQPIPPNDFRTWVCGRGPGETCACSTEGTSSGSCVCGTWHITGDFGDPTFKVRWKATQPSR